MPLETDSSANRVNTLCGIFLACLRNVFPSYRKSHESFIYLQLLLRKKAAEELKKEQERKAAERRRIIEERCGKPKNVDDANEGTLLRYII